MSFGEWNEIQSTLHRSISLIDGFALCDVSLVGGVDMSFHQESNDACAVLVVLAYPSLEVVYVDRERVTLTVPYTSGYLAFREVEHYITLLNRLKLNRPDLVPQVIMVDGTGILHPRGCGSASHFGVVADIPTIGVAKRIPNVEFEAGDEIERRIVDLHTKGEWFEITLDYVAVAACMKTSDEAINPVYVSVGHKVSIQTAIDLVHTCCITRIPEPIRQADIRSRISINESAA